MTARGRSTLSSTPRGHARTPPSVSRNNAEHADAVSGRNANSARRSSLATCTAQPGFTATLAFIHVCTRPSAFFGRYRPSLYSVTQNRVAESFNAGLVTLCPAEFLHASRSYGGTKLVTLVWDTMHRADRLNMIDCSRRDIYTLTSWRDANYVFIARQSIAQFCIRMSIYISPSVRSSE